MHEYSFPSDWSGEVEVKIVQSNLYCYKAQNETGEVESPALKIKLPFAEAAAKN